MAWNTILAGMKLTSTRLNNLYATLYVYKTGDTSRTATATPASDPDLTVSVEANAVYDVRVAIAHTYDNTADFKFTFVGPAGATMTNWMFKVRTVDGTESSGVSATITTVQTVASASGTFNQPLWIEGTLVTAGTAGTFAFQWSQANSVVPAAIVRAGSSMKLIRVG